MSEVPLYSGHSRGRRGAHTPSLEGSFAHANSLTVGTLGRRALVFGAHTPSLEVSFAHATSLTVGPWGGAC